MAYIKRPEHNPENYLKAILESIEYYNVYERLDIARWLLEGYKAQKIPQKRRVTQKAIVLELISKWAQVFEDLAMLSLMFAGKIVRHEGKPIVDKNLHPFELYATPYLSNKKMLKFYVVAKRGLSKTVISKIYAIKTAPQLLREKLILKSEYLYFKQEIDKLIEVAQSNFNRVAQVYSSRKKRGKLNYGRFIQAYFKTKHGFKVIHPTETTKLLWKFDDDYSALVKGVAELPSGRKVLTIEGFKELGLKDVEQLVVKIKNWSDLINEIVGAQLRKLDNPNFIVPMVRRLKTDEILKKDSKKKVGRNELCLCGSGLKFKKCCGR